MCFVPQRRTIFRHLNAKKWSEPVSFLHFWLGNVLRATTACTFSTSQLPDGTAPAPLASLLFHLPEPQIIWKTQWIATFLPFRAPASSFFSLFLFSDLLTSWLLLSDSSHLCFSICPYFHLSILLEVWLIYIYIYKYHAAHTVLASYANLHHRHHRYVQCWRETGAPKVRMPRRTPSTIPPWLTSCVPRAVATTPHRDLTIDHA